MAYWVYGKRHGSGKRMLPLGDGELVNNLMYANQYPDNRIDEIVTKMNSDNPDYLFEKRKVPKDQSLWGL